MVSKINEVHSFAWPQPTIPSKGQEKKIYPSFFDELDPLVNLKPSPPNSPELNGNNLLLCTFPHAPTLDSKFHLEGHLAWISFKTSGLKHLCREDAKKGLDPSSVRILQHAKELNVSCSEEEVRLILGTYTKQLPKSTTKKNR